MLESLKKSWRQLRQDKPGERFQAYYRRRQSQGASGIGLRRIVNIAAGILITLAGLFFLPAPGPGMVIIVIGLALLASELHFVAKQLDRAELFGRPIWQKFRRRRDGR